MFGHKKYNSYNAPGVSFLFVLEVEYSVILVVMYIIFFVVIITIVVFNAANCFVICNIIFVIVAFATANANATIVNYIFILAAATIVAIFF